MVIEIMGIEILDRIEIHIMDHLVVEVIWEVQGSKAFSYIIANYCCKPVFIAAIFVFGLMHAVICLQNLYNVDLIL